MLFKVNPFTEKLDLVQLQTENSGFGNRELPVGTIVRYPSGIPPENWLKCDGNAISNIDYPELYNVIGHTFDPPQSDSPLPIQHTNYVSEYGTVHASSEWGSSYTAWKAFNGNINYTDSTNNWCSSGTEIDSWIEYIFNDPIKIEKIDLYFGPCNSPSNVDFFEIQASNSPSDGYDILYRVDTPGFWRTRQEFIISPNEYTHYRLFFKRHAATWLEVSEWKFFQYIESDPYIFYLPNIPPEGNIYHIIKSK